MTSQIITLTFFRYTTIAQKWWGFKQMGLAPRALAKVPGLTFSKMFGSGGGNGFSIWPNFSVYSLLAVWEDEEQAAAFFSHHDLFQNFRAHSTEYWTVYLQTAHSRGSWDKSNPFTENVPLQSDAPIAVLTRATIRTAYLWRFWSFVPRVSQAIWDKHQEGLLFSAGIGELPLVQLVTFTIWKNSNLMQSYAYKGKAHAEVIKKTREQGWFKEELFARFHPYRAEGTWQGQSMHALLFPNEINELKVF